MINLQYLQMKMFVLPQMPLLVAGCRLIAKGLQIHPSSLWLREIA
jgi:hypothetical protein